VSLQRYGVVSGDDDGAVLVSALDVAVEGNCRS